MEKKFPLLSESDMALLRGLAGDEAVRRLKSDGHNELPMGKPRNLFAIGVVVLREPMFPLLLGSCGLYLLLGDIRKAPFLLFFVCVVVGTALNQQSKTGRVDERT